MWTKAFQYGIIWVVSGFKLVCLTMWNWNESHGMVVKLWLFAVEFL